MAFKINPPFDLKQNENTSVFERDMGDDPVYAQERLKMGLLF